MKPEDKLHQIIGRLERLPTSAAAEKAAIAGDLFALAGVLAKPKPRDQVDALLEKVKMPARRRRPRPRLVPIETV